MAVTSPTDWPGSLPDLRTIDSLLRCSICFDYINIALMVPSCSHNYCSLCIRRYMKYKRQCPTCNEEASPSSLTSNRTLDDLVKNFVAVRPHILKMSKQIEMLRDQGPKSSLDEKQQQSPPQKNSPKGTKASTSKRSPTNPHQSAPTERLPKASPVTPEPSRAVSNTDDSSSDFEGSDVQVMRGAKTMDTPSTSKGTAASLRRSAPGFRDQLAVDGAADGSELGAGCSTEMCTPSCSSSRSNMSSPSTSQTTPGGSSREKAECPVCAVPVPTKYINSHLDACLKRSNTSTGTTKRTPKRKRIPAMVWKLVPDKEIRRRLKEYNLSTKGKRYDLVKRLDEFILLYNAQCDAAAPKSVESISREVERMEQIKSQPVTHREAQVHKLKILEGQSEVQIQISRNDYLEAHKNQFGKLIAQARSRKKTRRTAPSSQGVASTSETEEVDAAVSARGTPEVEDSPSTDDASQNETTNHLSSLGSTNIVPTALPNHVCPEDDQEEITNHRLEESSVLESPNKTTDNGLSSQPTNEIAPTDDQMDSTNEHQATKDFLANLTSVNVQLPEEHTVLAPLSPCVTPTEAIVDGNSMKNHDENSMADNFGEPLCIPESPASVVVEKRNRKRKNQDQVTNASDSGSSFGDGEMVLRRSKRERKTVK